MTCFKFFCLNSQYQYKNVRYRKSNEKKIQSQEGSSIPTNDQICAGVSHADKSACPGTDKN